MPAHTVRLDTGPKTGAHHHGRLQSMNYVIKGHARMPWGGLMNNIAEQCSRI